MLPDQSAEEAARIIKSGERVFNHGGTATPNLLVQALAERNNVLKNVEIVHIHTEGNAP